eukprot:gene4233-14349_t
MLAGSYTFPYCGCDERNNVIELVNYTITDYEFNFCLRANQTNPRGSCSNSMMKVEINTFEDCRGTQIVPMVDGKLGSYFFDNQNRGEEILGVHVLKINQLNYTYEYMVNTSVCFNITIKQKGPGLRVFVVVPHVSPHPPPALCLALSIYLYTDPNITAMAPVDGLNPFSCLTQNTPDGSDVVYFTVCATGTTNSWLEVLTGSDNPSLNTTGCEDTAAYLSTNRQITAWAPVNLLGRFTCTFPIHTVPVFGALYQSFQVCANGAPNNGWLEGVRENPVSQAVSSALGYTNQCNVLMESSDTCDPPPYSYGARYPLQLPCARLAWKSVVCANGGLAANTWESGADSWAYLEQVKNFLGYSCSMYTKPSSTCTADESMVRGNDCMLEGLDLPHTCGPGNSDKNGGSESATTLMDHVPFQVFDATSTQTTFSFKLMRSGAPCTDLPRQTFRVTTAEWFQSFKITKIPERDPTSNILDITVKLRQGSKCDTVVKFLPNGILWYGGYNVYNRTDFCCGTGTAAARFTPSIINIG